MELAISIAANVALGIILLALLHWRNAGDDVRLAGAADAMDIFQRHFPDAARGSATLTADERGALIDLRMGVGILQRHGRRWNARLLKSGELCSVQLDRDGAINLAFADFGWPRSRFLIADADARARWMNRLEELRKTPPAPHHGDAHHA